MNTFIKRGFTLIELLVVIAIIGLLASVVLASLNSARLKGSTAAAQQTMKSIQTAGVICLGDNAAITLPGPAGASDADLINGGGGLLCAGNTSTYVALPAGWLMCDDDSTEAQAATGCGNEVSAQVTGTSFSLVAENSGSGDIVTCTQAACTTTNEATPN
jgi:prepilin-type N-terminal cleavage/methylation domain-containing protein